MSESEDLKRKVEELKDSNGILALAIQRTRKSIKRLKLEYGVLLERLDSRVTIDPELNYDDALPSLESFKEELLSKPIKKPRSKSQKVKDRDPNLPKRPTNAYLLYCEMNKEKIRQSGSPDVTKGLAESWKKLSEQERKPFYKLYNEDRKRYKQEMEAYLNNSAEKSNRTKTNGSVKLDVDDIEENTGSDKATGSITTNDEEAGDASIKKENEDENEMDGADEDDDDRDDDEDDEDDELEEKEKDEGEINGNEEDTAKEVSSIHDTESGEDEQTYDETSDINENNETSFQNTPQKPQENNRN